ncbi:MAG: tRNA (N6-isopentenyl adenosine(37)-C2)-methylthiotransferase MiaB [Chloroflexi bacterium CFX4]|nr:tRNA (N6-isopentenyl adenosine(37)-C2)-methylthiotransferase MiaB [Chloroflexi bacterium CFX4]MDL1921878.1 tRNA (N6-isopentenyl adenosine(37)-C2)-methylthiotransferase MiaB [Chloroflexi bacterium CFX3]
MRVCSVPTQQEHAQYYIWTLGCQMNVADSQRLASELEKLGLRAADAPESADVLVVNTCVVRQGAEEKGVQRLHALNKIKRQHPTKVIGLMGCMVGVRDPLPLRKRFPFVDVFMAPSDPLPMVEFLHERGIEDSQAVEAEARALQDALQDELLILPAHERGNLIAAHVPIVYGCSHACAFCIIPFRRGVERSRSVGEIVAEVRSLARQGVKEITLLGQIVDRYGKDIPDGPDLADLLRIVHEAGTAEGLQRIRFLTSHPNWMTDKLLDTVAELPSVMPHIEVPVQAGDDEVLRRMKRGYTQAEYRALIERIRARIPNVAINTDIIVGFPSETEAQFMQTYQLLEDLRLDKIHIAKYSPRPQTVSERTMPDDVPEAEKERRRLMLDEQHARISAERNAEWLGSVVPVLVEAKQGDKWRGRTPQNKLVFFADDQERRGQTVEVEITWTGAWSMQGRLPGAATLPDPLDPLRLEVIN